MTDDPINGQDLGRPSSGPIRRDMGWIVRWKQPNARFSDPPLETTVYATKEAAMDSALVQKQGAWEITFVEVAVAERQRNVTAGGGKDVMGEFHP